MKNRFPLYARILTWSFINLLLLAVLFFLLLRTQFQFRFDGLLGGGAMARTSAVARLIGGELETTDPEEWDHVFERYGAAYGVDFYLFSRDQQIAGNPVELPEEISRRLRWRQRITEGQPPRSEENPPAEEPRRRRQPPKAMVRTGDPKSYWLFARLHMRGGEGEPRSSSVLLVRSDTMRVGGLYLDYTPLVITGVAAVGLSMLLWLPFVRGITRSVGHMTRASRQIAEGNFAVRVPDTRRDELGELGGSINQMAVRLEALVGGQKRFLGDVAHELCSPLARLRMALGILEEKADATCGSQLESASRNAAQLAELVNELLSFSRASIGTSRMELGPVPVADLIADTVEREGIQELEVRQVIESGLTVLGDADLLRRALGNVLRNAVRYAGAHGAITIKAQEEGERVLLSVSDCGPGVPEEDLTQIFDPFYRLDASRNEDTGGTGLGLTIVKTCVESCNGQVAAHNRQPQGLEVEMLLDKADGA
ncbi:HAMP domain-containing sensor histidine kinase [Kiritimatiellaeota bacterium B1221]|nr:HAMP domain-containing sensor histidine kinase [Kiritimatiellaeota bacterium B1221]